MKRMDEKDLLKAAGFGAAIATAGGSGDFVLSGYRYEDNHESVDVYTAHKPNVISLRTLVNGVKKTGSKFFSPNNLGFFGDTFSNFYIEDGGDTWVLCRKEPVRGGLSGKTFFKKDTFKRVSETGEEML